MHLDQSVEVFADEGDLAEAGAGQQPQDPPPQLGGQGRRHGVRIIMSR